MSQSIDSAFIINYETEVHAAYQRMGSKLRNTVRTKPAVIGKETTFQKVGKGTAASKTRHGKVPVMNIDHTPVTCTLSDWYAGDWVDDLDLLKTNIDEMKITAQAGAYALGRKTDELIITAAVSGTNASAANNVGLTRAQIMEAWEAHGNNDVPDDGNRFAWVSPRGWEWLLTLKEFADADFVGQEGLVWAGVTAKRWLGTLWAVHSGLPKTGNVRTCLWYHKSAIGHAIGQDVKSDITWHGDYAAHFVNNSMSQGACLIDGTGVFELLFDESVALPA